MVSVKDHYDNLLGPVYSWMLGDMAVARENARTELCELGIDERAPGVAIDLGAGSGLYSIPLAELGFSVVAIDSCAGLLGELRNSAGDSPIQPVSGNLTAFRTFHPGPADVILCMGDTLTHLPTRESVEVLFEEVKTALEPGGVFVATFRDYVSAPLEGTERFIPVRSDEKRILTCFLEYGDEVVTVYDLLHCRTETGWTASVSAYTKLRLDPAWVETELKQLGFRTILEPGPRGMLRLVGRLGKE